MEYTRERLGELLVSAGLITDEQLLEVLDHQARMGGKIGEILVNQLILTEDQIAGALATQKQLEHVNLTMFPIDRSAVNLIPERMASKRMAIPIGFDDSRILLAMADPLDVEAMDDVEMRTGFKVTPVVASPSQIAYAIDKYIASADAVHDVVETSIDEEDETAELGESAIGEDVPIVRLVNQLVREAVRDGASDIHVEPEAKSVRVRYRIDGVLHEIMTLPASSRAGVTSRLKIMAEMDIAERRRPQDGRIAVKVDDRPVDIRVASLPTPHGESLVLRILNSELSFKDLKDVGLRDADFKKVTELLSSPYGALLISGPTGSGKSTTMYGALQRMKDEQTKIITIEDPIEYQMANVTQMAVHSRIGLTFAAGLRTILRSDPDVVMVGEIRDPETAEIAIRAALTGHRVLTSIHTNDAPSALNRLNDMGVPPYITSSALLGVLAQRLVRVLCPECKQEVKLPGPRLVAAGFSAAESKKIQPFGPAGCDACSHSGYRGRIGVFEIMPMNDTLVRAYLDNAPADRLRQIALESGMRTLRRDALDKVAAGITSLEEVDRVVV